MKNAVCYVLALLLVAGQVHGQAAGGGFPARPTVSELRVRTTDPANTRSGIVRGDTNFEGSCRSDPVSFFAYNMENSGGDPVVNTGGVSRQWQMDLGFEENYENQLYPPTGNLTADAGTNATSLTDAALTGITASQLVGYCLYNVTRGQSRMVTANTGGASPVLTLASPITGQTAGDAFRVLIRETETYTSSCFTVSTRKCLRIFQANVDKAASERLDSPVMSSFTMRFPRQGNGLSFQPDGINEQCFNMLPGTLLLRLCSNGTTNPVTDPLSQAIMELQTVNGNPSTQAGTVLRMWGRSFSTGAATRNFEINTTTGAGYTNLSTWDASGGNFGEVVQFITTGAGAAGRTMNIFANSLNQNGNPVVSATSGTFTVNGTQFGGSSSGSITVTWSKQGRHVCLAGSAGSITVTTGPVGFMGLTAFPSNLWPLTGQFISNAQITDGTNFFTSLVNLGAGGLVDFSAVDISVAPRARSASPSWATSTTYTIDPGDLAGCYLSAT